eukprot:gnl/TRDRNA2_/TRDRNA2_83740_c1_seq1.p1 gnl/TRDRNA2_/TRDRNA2_83740_c1~~gnl/TRDRNA2_/TRDRNA2_83740_c1_seq1.p1  ORF type:complete len:406 (+),score=107.49 gnl/TRDRNA2_/TRDRNA2_83740_c1_seq1:182-1219(+)
MGDARFLPELINKSIHRSITKQRGEYGRPEMADRIAFDVFAKNFGLPYNHGVIEHARQRMSEEVDLQPGLWLDLALEVALREQAKEYKIANKDGKSPAAGAIMRMYKLIKDLGSPEPEKQEKMRKLVGIGMDTRAASIKRCAEHELAKDEPLKTRKEKGDAPRAAADRLLVALRDAYAYGCERRMPDMVPSIAGWEYLRSESVRRNGLHLVATKPNKPGAAEAVAEKIENNMKQAIKEGVPVENETLQAARMVAKAALEEENLRKRADAAAARKAEMAVSSLMAHPESAQEKSSIAGENVAAKLAAKSLKAKLQKQITKDVKDGTEELSPKELGEKLDAELAAKN